MRQETTIHTGLPDLPIVGSAQAIAQYSDFSIDDYGRQGTQSPYQIVQPAYPAPEWLGRFENLKLALRECSTLCQLKGKPYRVVRWERTGSGNRGGVPCKVCKGGKPTSRFPRRVPLKGGSGCLDGFEDATPIAEFHPNGQRIVFNKCGEGSVVGRPNYIVSHTPVPRHYQTPPLPQRYIEAIKTGQLFARRHGRRAYICVGGFGQKCDKRSARDWVPVVYVEPGGLVKRYDKIPTGTTTVSGVSPSYFRELVAESRGATFLGQGA